MNLLRSHWGVQLKDIQPSEKGKLVMQYGDKDANVPLVMTEKAAVQRGIYAELRIIKK